MPQKPAIHIHVQLHIGFADADDKAGEHLRPHLRVTVNDGSGVRTVSSRTDQSAEDVGSRESDELALRPTSSRPDAPTFTDGKRCSREKRLVQMELLDVAGVANGTKAIDAWLHKNWTVDLAARWGRFSNPATIKRWRTRSVKRVSDKNTSQVDPRDPNLDVPQDFRGQPLRHRP